MHPSFYLILKRKKNSATVPVELVPKHNIMKIVNTSTNQAYQLNPGTQLEVERPNLFFNDWGEQTNPVDLPDTDLNRWLTGYPDLLSNRKKPSTKISCTIQDGEYFMPCRQAILGAQRHSKISTSFYMNEGSFLAKISDVSLKELFGDEVIPGINTVTEGINFCRSLVKGTNPNYAIFPILIDDGSTFQDGSPAYKQINRYGSIDEKGEFRDDLATGTIPDFYNAGNRTETVDDSVITITAGFYISPFIRANYLLKRIFQHFGYTLQDNFFTQTKPFPDMVFINTCADSLVNGTIRIVDLLPDCMCNTILEVFRKKFLCEFLPDETGRTIKIELFKDCLSQKPSHDLSPYLTSHPDISFPEAYQQLILSSESKLSDGGSIESEDSLANLAIKYPSVEYDYITGTFSRKGYQYYGTTLFGPLIFSATEKVSSSSMRYYEGGNLKTKEIKVPDIQPEFRNFYVYDQSSLGPYLSSAYQFLFAGSPRFLNSKIIPSSATSTEETSIESDSDNEELKPMLAFAYKSAGLPRGTITNIVPNTTNVRLSDYSLCYNGPDGIFERFYRSYDDLLRNSLHPAKVNLLLPDHLKISLPAHLPVLLNGQKMLIDRIKYQIGGKNEPLESEMLTMNLYEPVSSAKQFADIIPTQNYEWVAQSSSASVTEAEYNASPYKELEFDPIFPSQKPTAELAASGEKFYERTTCLALPGIMGGLIYIRVTYWMICKSKFS